jgi:hypothetical protein
MSNLVMRFNAPAPTALAHTMPRSSGYRRSPGIALKSHQQNPSIASSTTASVFICDQIFNDAIQAVCSEPTLECMRAAAQRFTAYGYGL